jgi:hypothetical protein
MVRRGAAASLQEELKTTTLEQWKTELILAGGDMPDSHAERGSRLSRAGRNTSGRRAEDNKRKAQFEYLEDAFSEWPVVARIARPI